MYYLDKDENKSDPAKYNLSPALNFDNARPYLEFAKANGIAMRGHTLVWYSQTPEWIFHEGFESKNEYVSREEMLARMENMIKVAMGDFHYNNIDNFLQLNKDDIKKNGTVKTLSSSDYIIVEERMSGVPLIRVDKEERITIK